GAYQLAFPDGSFFVELHWRLTQPHFPFPLRLERHWERLPYISLMGTPVRSFPAEELLLYLCVHGSMHGWGRLGWICDVAEQVRSHPGLDWQRVADLAASLGCRRMLLLGLTLATELLGADVPVPLAREGRAAAPVLRLAVLVRNEVVAGP